MIDPNQLKKIVRFCQKNGIIKFKSGDFEIEIKQQPIITATKEMTGEMAAQFPSWASLTPEQQLLWSSTPDVPQG